MKDGVPLVPCCWLEVRIALGELAGATPPTWIALRYYLFSNTPKGPDEIGLAKGNCDGF